MVKKPKPKPKPKRAKPEPREESLIITDDPQAALARFLKSKKPSH
jgi:hypothetical protein